MTHTWTTPQLKKLDAPDTVTRSYWLRDLQATKSPGPGHQPLLSSVQADICIVGGAFTGLWTAIELKQRQPSINVVLLEGSLCGAGASGTNAGILMNLWPKLPALVRFGGQSEGPEIARASVDAIDHIKRRACDQHMQVLPLM